ASNSQIDRLGPGAGEHQVVRVRSENAADSLPRLVDLPLQRPGRPVERSRALPLLLEVRAHRVEDFGQNRGRRRVVEINLSHRLIPGETYAVRLLPYPRSAPPNFALGIG